MMLAAYCATCQWYTVPSVGAVCGAHEECLWCKTPTATVQDVSAHALNYLRTIASGSTPR